MVGPFHESWPSRHLGPPGPGRRHYLPELEYFDQWSAGEATVLESSGAVVFVPGETGFKRGVYATVRCVARWADEYYAEAVHGLGPTREGVLSADAAERERTVEDLLAWVDEHLDPWRLPLGMLAISLLQDGRAVLNQGDGTPGPLTLSPARFAELQDWWEARGLPRDLYFPAEELRAVALPPPMEGSPAAVETYTPRQWARLRPAEESGR